MIEPRGDTAFCAGDGEEQEMTDAGIEITGDHIERCRSRHPRVRAKARDRLRSGDVLDDEQRLYELLDSEGRLRDEITQMLRLSEAKVRPPRARSGLCN